MSNKKKNFLIIAVIVMLIVAGCGSQSEKKIQDKNEIRIMTSFYPVYIATINITKNIEGVTVENLTAPQTGCLHDYQFTTKDMKKLEGAGIFVANGAGMEGFLDKIKGRQKQMKIIDASSGIILLKDDKEANPHVWLSISREIEQIKNISRSLSEYDKEHAARYKANAEEYISKLSALREEGLRELADIKHRDIVTFHEAFPYFAEEFNLNIAAVVEREPGTEPAPKEIEETIKKLKGLSSKVIFTEPQYPAKTAEIIAKECGGQVYTLDPLVTGVADAKAINAYIDGMRNNIQVLKKALK